MEDSACNGMYRDNRDMMEGHQEMRGRREEANEGITDEGSMEEDNTG